MIEPTAGNSDTSRSDLAIERRSARTRFGMGLILLSGVLWFSLFAIPFLPLTMAHKAALAAGVFVAVQLTWWTGAAVAGAQTVQRLKSRLGRSK